MNSPVKPIKVTFPVPRQGYWDGGAKMGGQFTPDHYSNGDKHPGPKSDIRWGCWELNFYFSCGSGISWNHARSVALRWLRNHTKVPATIS